MMHRGYVDTAGGQLHFRKREGSGIPIVCLHQTASSSAMFEAFAAAYEGDEAIVALDTPGFGGSFDPEGMPDMAGYAAILSEAIKALGIDRYHIFGHHTGASIGIELTVLEPERIVSLVMIGPVVLTAEEREAFGQVYPQPFELQADGSHLRTMWDYVKGIGGDSSLTLHHREVVDTARAWEGHIKVYSKIWDQDFAALYAKVPVPICIMCAENDILWPMFERAKEARPDAVAKVIPGSNFQPDEAPLETAKAVSAFLREL